MPSKASVRSAAKPKALAKKGALKRKPPTIDAYLAGLSDVQRAALEAIRRAVQAAAPTAEECITYGVPAFRLDGKVLVGFGATARACVFYPMSGSTIAAHRQQLAGFKTTKGSVHFPPEAPIKPALIKVLTRARIAENQR